MRRKLFMMMFWLAAFLAGTLKGSAQTQVSGVVADESGFLVGATVSIKGTATQTQTDDAGEYRITVPGSDAILVFSYTGYTSQEVTVAGQTRINVTLRPDEESLEEVVVVGYGTQRKSDLTGSVASIKSADLNQRPAVNVEQQMAGRIAGVSVSTNSGRPGGQTNVRIRGYNSVNASNAPLYIIDGVIGAGPIAYLNPNDIESLEVLKDASATAIYGARGANGVIIVTTKKGSKDGGKISYDPYFSFGTMAKKLDVLNAAEFLALEESAYANVEKYDPEGYASGKYVDPQTKRTNSRLFDASGNPLYDTDWQREATRQAFSQNHNLSFVGGNQETSFGLFMNYANEDGIIKESFLKRYSGRLTIESQLKPWMKLGGTFNFNHVEENRVDGSVGALNVTRMMIEGIPIAPVKYSDGVWGGNADYPGMENGENPVNILTNRKDLYLQQTAMGNVFANINLGSDLQFRTSIGYNINNLRNNFFSGKYLRLLSADQEGIAEIRNTRENYWQFENYLTYDKTFGEIHRLNAMAGLGWQQFDYFYTFAGSQGYSDDFYQWNNLGVGSRPSTPGSDTNKWSMNSYFARVNYSLLDKYLFTVTGRLDGSSKFGISNKYAFFPSAALAWRVSEEDFLKDAETVSDLKLRTSYGMTGNSEIGVFQSLANLAAATAIFEGNRASGVGIGTLANPNLKWEKTAQYDVGIELGLFNDRIRIETDLYYKKTTDMLLNAPVPSSSGYTNIYKNIGNMENKGVEVALHTDNLNGALKWNTSFNISFNRNKVLALGEANDDIFANPYFLANTNVIRVGQPVGSFYGYVREGTWASDEAAEAARYNLLPGDVKLRDVNDDGQINEADRVIIGSGLPKFFGGFLNTFVYKNFDVALELQFSYGNDILNMSKSTGEDRIGQVNSYATVLNGWTPTNQQTMVAEHRPASSYYTMNIDTRWVEDGSFLRGKNLLVGYTLPAGTLQRIRASRVRVYASLQNFFVWTNYSGYDPEVTTYTDAFAQGIEFFGYPKPRTFMLGLNMTF
ncbi:SusC/RagA family TonB-linked outer membrane protein [Parapedobacter koreensis]|uniref:TonB-linked outer membrane protein, SusC/RagA family n=1 Tax=Parapedobacter koreensis TaxID=332977 RepID=A0A1H7QN56_9SPHI|nr:TonB-dependent receptor [Parapedobacter koreensis]SEL49045.1 TonB-linked outer membrane protein, SusC/RagA family [Parapedobacter koreensis]